MKRIHSLRTPLLLLAGVLLLNTSGFNAHAGPISMEKGTSMVTTPWSPFAKGNTEFELTAGAFTGLVNGSEFEPDTAYALGSARLGWMLNDPSGNGFLRGNFEFLVGAFGGWIFDGPGDYVVGSDIGLRYNFVQPSAKLVPFLQIGGGAAYSDASEDDLVQDLIGDEWSWELQGALGVRYFLSERVSLTAMVQYQHFSNAGSNERNHGLDSVGGLIGVSWFF